MHSSYKNKTSSLRFECVFVLQLQSLLSNRLLFTLPLISTGTVKKAEEFRCKSESLQCMSEVLLVVLFLQLWTPVAEIFFVLYVLRSFSPRTKWFTFSVDCLIMIFRRWKNDPDVTGQNELDSRNQKILPHCHVFIVKVQIYLTIPPLKKCSLPTL